jgi:hypothetical protein
MARLCDPRLVTLSAALAYGGPVGRRRSTVPSFVWQIRRKGRRSVAAQIVRQAEAGSGARP